MKISKKYHCQTAQVGASWTAEVVRRVTAKTSVVTTSKTGFASEADALIWGQTEVAALLKNTNVKELNRRRAKKSA